MGWDFHTHTTASDGALTPTQLVERASSLGLSGIAITDHNTVAGIEEAQRAGEKLGVCIIAGVEVGARWKKVRMHVLGLGVSHTDHVFLDRLAGQRRIRQRKNEFLLQYLRGLGHGITEEEIILHGGRLGGEISELHVATLLVKRGIVGNHQAALERYIEPALERYDHYDETGRIEPVEASRWIKEAGGKAALAHPGVYKVDCLATDWIIKLWGIEADHPSHSRGQRERYRSFAQRHGLVATAGSDFHRVENQQVVRSEIGSCSLPEGEGRMIYRDLYGEDCP
ncbi:PHP domain-containing protein [Pasteuria penetrans]|uniref:PHP domain-containing protein n=1 Tax=Pasteuria penetrans TaxID=86005 RepID=UPI000FC203FF|nr:PHP domain-containing protein [Pasteuria penetrans]